MRLEVYSRQFRGLAALCGIVILSGCASMKHKHAPPPPAASVAPGPQRVGTIAMVNEELNFVLVDVGSLYAPAAGTALKSFSGAEETGILAVDPEKRRPFIVADIIKGAPKVGDEVRE
jgi:hypothetical protein